MERLPPRSWGTIRKNAKIASGLRPTTTILIQLPPPLHQASFYSAATNLRPLMSIVGSDRQEGIGKGEEASLHCDEGEDNEGGTASLFEEEEGEAQFEEEEGEAVSEVGQDDDLTDVEEEINCNVEAKKRGISLQRFLRELYESGNPSVGPLGEPGFGKFDFLVVYGKPKIKRRVSRSQVKTSPPPNVPPSLPPTGWGDESDEPEVVGP